MTKAAFGATEPPISGAAIFMEKGAYARQGREQTGPGASRCGGTDAGGRW